MLDEVHAGMHLGGTAQPISPRTLQRWRQEGVGPSWVRVGRLVRYRRTALDEFLARGTRISTGDSGERA